MTEYRLMKSEEDEVSFVCDLIQVLQNLQVTEYLRDGKDEILVLSGDACGCLSEQAKAPAAECQERSAQNDHAAYADADEFPTSVRLRPAGNS